MKPIGKWIPATHKHETPPSFVPELIAQEVRDGGFPPLMNHETPPSFIPEKLAQEDQKFGRVDILRSNPFAILLPFLCTNPELAVFGPPNHGRRH
jgi:hypothetical protein